MKSRIIGRAKRVLVVTPQYAPDLGPSAPIYTALCEDLAQRGYEVTVVTAFPHYGGNGIWSGYKSKLFQEERLNGVRVIRTYVYATRERMWQRLLYHASMNLLSLLAAYRVPRPDVILGDAPALWSGIPLLVRGIWSRVPMIYVVHDIHPDIAVRLGVLKSPVLIKVIGHIERFFYRQASFISVLSDGFRENLRRKGVPEGKIIVIPACSDTNLIRPLPRANKFRAEWRLGNKFILLYTANIGLPQGLDNAVRAMALLADCPDVAFVMVGEGAAKADLQRMVQQMKLDNVFFFPLQPREDVPFIFGLADVGLVSLKREVVVEAVPSKTYSIMASGRPFIATVQDGTEVSRLIERARCGLQVEPDAPAALAQAIRQLYENPGLRAELGNNARRYAEENYTRAVATDKYEDLIKKLAQ